MSAATPVAATRRRTARRRAALGVALAVVLAWAGLSFANASGTAGAEVGLVQGLADDGSIATVTPLSSIVTHPQGKAQLAEGVAFSRIDVSQRFHDAMRVSMSWTNPTEFRSTSQIADWQIRFGLYYPVRDVACDGSDVASVHAVSVEAGGTTFCAYRDTSADGAGTMDSGADEGTQFMSARRLVADLSPGATLPDNPCTDSGTNYCNPTGDSNKRTYFVVGSLTNPGGHVPPGKVGDALDMDLHVRVSRVGN